MDLAHLEEARPAASMISVCRNKQDRNRTLVGIRFSIHYALKARSPTCRRPKSRLEEGNVKVSGV
jgi:hypothetical protein